MKPFKMDVNNVLRRNVFKINVNKVLRMKPFNMDVNKVLRRHVFKINVNKVLRMKPRYNVSIHFIDFEIEMVLCVRTVPQYVVFCAATSRMSCENITHANSY